MSDPSDLDDLLGPATRATRATVSVDRNRIDHSLTLHAYGVDPDGNRIRIEIDVPAGEVPSLMTAIIINGGHLLTDVADAWRRGDCSTCLNIRLVEQPRAGGRTERVHCPDCSPDVNPLIGFPIMHRPGEPSTARR